MANTEVLSIADFCVRFCLPPCRVYDDDGAWYVFRDKNVGDHRLQCQYGVLDTTKQDGTIIWADCAEGSLFTDVDPIIDPQCDRVVVRVEPRRNFTAANNMQSWAFR